jgi:hypothetical protein
MCRATLSEAMSDQIENRPQPQRERRGHASRSRGTQPIGKQFRHVVAEARAKCRGEEAEEHAVQTQISLFF